VRPSADPPLLAIELDDSSHDASLVFALLASFGGRFWVGQKTGLSSTVATLLAIVVALFLDDIRTLLHRPEIEFQVGRDFLEDAPLDFDDAHIPAQWIRGRIKRPEPTY
jgi:hypothetical protein